MARREAIAAGEDAAVGDTVRSKYVRNAPEMRVVEVIVEEHGRYLLLEAADGRRYRRGGRAVEVVERG